MKDFIAERKLIVEVKETGERKELVIRVGVPYWIPDDELAACPVEWKGLFDKVADAKGIDLLQALHLAANIEPTLDILRNKYEFYWPSGERYHED